MIPGSGPESVRYDSGSFRDPNSRVWRDGSRVLRGLNEAASANFAALTATSFYRGACKSGDLVSSEPVEAAVPEGSDWALVLEHGSIDVITYAHEWSFSMLQDAASLTLKLVRAAIDEDMTSKDATPYNVQFVGAKPTFIDIASFEPYRKGEPWWVTGSSVRCFCIRCCSLPTRTSHTSHGCGVRLTASLQNRLGGCSRAVATPAEV